MNQKEIHELVKLINKTDVREFKLKDKDFQISIKTGKDQIAQVVPVVQNAAPIIQAAPQVQAPTPATTSTLATNDASVEEKANDDSKYTNIKSPMVGTFYRKPAPDKPVFAKVGDVVKAGDTLCVIEAMKLFNEIECEIDGTIMKVLVDDSTPVEYDQPLFLIDPA